MASTGPYYLTFNAPTRLWSTNSAGVIDYTNDLSLPLYPAGGPFLVTQVIIPDDPVHQTGGYFWELQAGDKTGWLVSFWTNELGYGSITVTGTAAPAESPGAWGNPTIQPDHPWRLLIKGMEGSVAGPYPYTITFNAPTILWSRTNEGIISYVRDTTAPFTTLSSGTYSAEPLVVPYDPVHKTGGSFYELKSGPYQGWLVSAWTNTLSDAQYGPYGNITIAGASVFSRGPGATIATFYHPNAHLCGASLNYNAAGEMHFTLLVDDPNIPLIAPKQCHYAIEFQNIYDGTWNEVFAGVVWDLDATETEVVYTGIDYLGLLSTIVDERYDPTNFNRAVPVGSKYIYTTISDIITQHLQYSINLPNSWVNFIQLGKIDATLTEVVTIWSASQDSLSFILGLINSHRQGSGKNTRLYVTKDVNGVYRFNLDEDPGVDLDNLPVVYGQLAQGYHAIKFGRNWASRANLIGRAMDPTQTIVRYESDDSAVDQSVWGRIGGAFQVVYTMDGNDLKRRAKQVALDDSRLGRQISVGLRLGSFCPLEGYNLLDRLPLQINHGAVSTQDWSSDAFGQDSPTDPSTVTSLYWAIFQLQWESYDDSHWITNFGLWPVGGGTPPPPDTAEPLYDPVEDRGGATWVFVEVTGVNPQPVYEYGTVLPDQGVSGAYASATLQPAVGLDPTLAHIAFVGVGATVATAGTAPSAGWIVDLPAQSAGEGSASAFLQHIIVSAGPTTITPGPIDFVPPVDGYAAPLIVFAAAGTTAIPHVRQVYVRSFGVTGYHGTYVPFAFNIDPLPGSLLLAVGVPGGYWGWGDVWLPGRGYTADNGGNNTEWADSGLGPMSVGTPPSPGAMRVALRTAHPTSQSVPAPVATKTPVAYGDGAPPDPATSTPTSNTYIDNATGVQYVLSADGTTWTAVPGSGYLNSGKYDFTFLAATTWTINHVLNGYPNVTLLDTNGNKIDADVQYMSVSQIVISFYANGAPVAVAGSAHLSIG